MNWRQRGGMSRWHGRGPERLWLRLPRPRFRQPEPRSLAGIVAPVLAGLPLASVFFIAAGIVPAVPAATWAGTPADVVRLIALMSIAFWHAAVAWTVLLAALGLWALSR